MLFRTGTHRPFIKKGSVLLTYENLKNEVLSLGFMETLENEGHLLLMANRALSLIRSDFPHTETLCLYRHYRAPLRAYTNATEEKVTVFCGEIVAFAYRLRDGAILFDGVPLTLSATSGTHTVCAERDGEFSVSGDGEMFAIAVYSPDTPLSLCEINLPFVRYPLGDYVKAPLAVTSVPTDKDGTVIEGARYEECDVILPRTYSGEFFIQYERAPEPITKTTKNVDICDALIPLFPLLVCAYVWLDDEPERAQYYMALYREGRERMLRRKPSYAVTYQSDVLGWT